MRRSYSQLAAASRERRQVFRDDKWLLCERNHIGRGSAMQNREQVQPSLQQLLQMTSKARADFARRRSPPAPVAPNAQTQSVVESRHA